MTLIELSNLIGKPAAQIAKEIEEQHRIILLDNKLPLKDTIVTEYQGRYPNLFTDPTHSEIDETSETHRFLKYCIDNRYRIIIDTCSLLRNGFDAFYQMFLDVKKDSETKIFVPFVVCQELNKKINDMSKPKEVRERAKMLLMDFIPQELKKGHIIVVGTEEDQRLNKQGEMDYFADPIFEEKVLFLKYTGTNVLVIAQDHALTKALLSKTSDNEAIITKANVVVKKLNTRGALVDNAEDCKNPELPGFNI